MREGFAEFLESRGEDRAIVGGGTTSRWSGGLRIAIGMSCVAADSVNKALPWQKKGVGVNLEQIDYKLLYQPLLSLSQVKLQCKIPWFM